MKTAWFVSVFERPLPILEEPLSDVDLCALMSITVDVIRHHLDYTAWASSKLVDAARALTPEELMRDFATADHNVLGTLVHVYAGRIEGNPPARFLIPEQDML